MRHETAAQVIRVLIGTVSAALLTSLGGAQIMAAPITVPALWWAAKTSGGPIARGFFIVIAALTMSLVGWLVAYETVGERQPFILLIPSLFGAATLAAFALTTRRGNGRTATT